MSTNPTTRGASVDRVIEALAAAGCSPRPSGSGAVARCPLSEAHAHGDRNPSLSVTYNATKAKAVVVCHRGEHSNNNEPILDALRLLPADLYDEPLKPGNRGNSTPQPAYSPKTTAAARKTPQSASGGAKRARKVTDRYNYTDEHGQPLMRVLRYDPKGFSQQKWNGTGMSPGHPRPPTGCSTGTTWSSRPPRPAG